jgi:hypothetical protein
MCTVVVSRSLAKYFQGEHRLPSLHIVLVKYVVIQKFSNQKLFTVKTFNGFLRLLLIPLRPHHRLLPSGPPRRLWLPTGRPWAPPPAI